MGMTKNDASVLGLTLIGVLALAWGLFGLMSAANGTDGASPIVAVVFVLIGAAVLVAGWLSWRNERKASN